MRPHLHRAAAIGALIAAAGGATADGLSYSYLEPRWAETELDDGIIDVGATIFNDLTGVDVKTRFVGGGLALPLSPRADVVIRGGFANAELETPLFADEDDGTFVSLGARVLVTPEIELYGDFRSLNLDDAGDEEWTTIGLEFYASDTFSVGPSARSS